MAPPNSHDSQADLERAGSPSRSIPAASPLAQVAIAMDLAQDISDDASDLIGSNVRLDEPTAGATYHVNVFGTTPHSLAGSYTRASYFSTGLRGGAISHSVDQEHIPQLTREQALLEERDLLSDNHIISPSEYPIRGLQRSLSRTLGRTTSGETQETRDSIDADNGLNRKISRSSFGSKTVRPTETTALLSNIDSDADPKDVDQKWEAAVMAGLIKTTWKREAQVIGNYWLPLMVAFLLQYSLTLASILAVGRLGKAELGAVSLAGMTSQITGYAIFQGLATSLDTLCAQAYGSGHLKLVGLQMQRMVYFLLLVSVPIGVLWAFADRILLSIVPEQDVAILAGKYLKVIILGLPGYALFESGKRYVQAQGLFTGPLYVLLIISPLNAFLNWFLVWVRGWYL
jgi:multidrug resistance protein, MATE family